MSVTDLYAILEVSREATPDEIKSSYRHLARKYHPDVNPDNPEAEEKFKEVSQAYSVLGDEEKKAHFDQFGSVEMGQAQNFSGQVDFSDLFEAFIGGFGGGSPVGRASGRDGEDLQARVTLSLLDVLTGVERPINYRRMAKCSSCKGSGAAEGTQPKTCGACDGRGAVTRVQQTFFGAIRTSATCPQCRGTGQIIEIKCETCKGRMLEVVDAEIDVTVPPGVEGGMTLRVAGRGSDGVGTGAPGDLFVVISLKDDKRFVRRGNDLYTEIDLTFPQAALGDQMEIEGLTGALVIDVKRGTQPGHEFRLRGEGLPRLHGGARGSLIAIARIKVPKRSSDEETGLLIEYAEKSGGPIPKGSDGGFLGGLFSKKKKK